MIALKVLVAAFAVIILVLLGVLLFYQPVKGPTVEPGAGQPQAQQLVSPDGALAISTSSLLADAAVSSPLSVSGTVTGGGWFFEATFPIKVVDGDGTVLGRGTAHADSDWMSTGTVPWDASITFSAPHFKTGEVIFQNDNPSGDPAKAKALDVPVRFQ